MSEEKKLLVVQYLPKYDGELHIKVEEQKYSYKFSFTHAKKGNEWETLVEAARGILLQNSRLPKKER